MSYFSDEGGEESEDELIAQLLTDIREIPNQDVFFGCLFLIRQTERKRDR